MELEVQTIHLEMLKTCIQMMPIFIQKRGITKHTRGEISRLAEMQLTKRTFSTSTEGTMEKWEQLTSKIPKLYMLVVWTSTKMGKYTTANALISKATQLLKSLTNSQLVSTTRYKLRLTEQTLNLNKEMVFIRLKSLLRDLCS